MNPRLVRVYTKDVSFESPLAPAVFREEWKPEVEMSLQAGGALLQDGLIEASLKVNVDARLGGRTAMIVEVVVAGLFAVEEGEAGEEEVARAVGVTCPSILYPYARETVTSLSVRGGFPPFVMQPADFDELDRQRREEAPDGRGAE